jgi:hypothetical protein
VAPERDERVPDPHLRANPIVLGVRVDAVDLDQHPEPARIDVPNACLAGQPID